MAKQVWYPGRNVRHEHHKERQLSMMLQVEVGPGWNEAEDDIADKLVASGLCSEKPIPCAECNPPRAAAPAPPPPPPPDTEEVPPRETRPRK